VKLAIRTAVAAAGILVPLLAVGCGTHAAGASPDGPASAGPATVQGCAAYGVYAIEHRITVTAVPTACRGLSKAEINVAAANAILRVAGGAPKSVWRKRAARAAPFLSHLITGPGPAGTPLPVSAPGQTTYVPIGGRNLGMDIAALFAWLVTAGSGAYVLGGWISGGGTLRQHVSATGSPPTVIFAHFGLAATGLVVWVAYLVAGWAALAWTAVGVLLPVAGFGVAIVSIGLPGRAASDAADGASPAAGGMLGAGPVGTAVIDKAETRRASRRRSLSPLVALIHGLLAFTTIALVLLAAIGHAAG
jgi:manganese efflux pump family protein